MTMIQHFSARTKAMLAAALTVLVVSISGPGAFAQDQPKPILQQGVSQVQDEVRGVLSQYGSFVQHAKYGEVWVPTVTPQGWHPYPPCHWVNSRQYGWYYDDKTPWGQIVHHYGRWVHDNQMGWIWTPGTEFSPGWVVWRSSPQWVGWAPMLPDEDVQTIAAADFNNAGYWIFVETQKFAQGCDGVVVAPAQIPEILKQTVYVTDIQLVGGITVFILPQYVVGPLIEIDIIVTPWPTWFLAQILIDWNFVWNNTVIITTVVYDNCEPKILPNPQPINNPPPPSPPPTPPPPTGKRVNDGQPPVVVTSPVCPLGTVLIDRACRLTDPCPVGTMRTGNGCVPHQRPEPPPTVVNNDPCAKLGAGEFRRCIRGPQSNPGNDKPPVKRPNFATGPVGNQIEPGGGQKGQNPIVGVGPRPPVIFHPNSESQRTFVREPTGPSNRLPQTIATPIRGNPNPVVLGPGGGGFSRGSVGSTAGPSNNAIAGRRTLPMAMPSQGGSRQTIIR